MIIIDDNLLTTSNDILYKINTRDIIMLNQNTGNLIAVVMFVYLIFYRSGQKHGYRSLKNSCQYSWR